MILNAFFLAFKQIRKNYLRAFLTMLGIIIGVGSVIVMLALGNGATQKITSEISSLGSNLLIVFPARNLNNDGKSKKRNFTMQEVDTIRSRLPGVRAVAPFSSTSVIAQYFSSNTQTQANGITKDYFEVTLWDLSSGRSFRDIEYTSGASVCILGESVKKALFGDENPLGAQIKVVKNMCEVIGVLEAKGQGAMGNDQDDAIFMPFKTFQRNVSGKNTLFNVNRIMISLNDDTDSTEATNNLKQILRDIRDIKAGQRDNFEIMDTKEIEKMVSSTTSVLTLFLGAIAGVSLIVGGIGIMNIMLVSVTERTREIGTRLAIGALEGEVLLQFLIEAVVVSSLGGIIGIFLAFFVALGASHLMNIPFVFHIDVAVFAFLFSALIGVIFGYLPARRASRLNPIEALRYE
ncbi:ABC transporter permease [Helicobacter cappadocius]|uniref:ABC transporter permease n=1 Tax=Helicobacter cappadocius TaxID=3063998 RepID=A0AA90PS22_9HELI|nr:MULTISPECIES: ABC transporter permease [unclassified Helicobacter]MDO7252928.1 ABC transporter permease [Helicobacter sp. faydin-H75]MDP2539082.1 ABC transporter permease [Helicobacter sp. faydin-H76]